jgi:hypothetical protein
MTIDMKKSPFGQIALFIGCLFLLISSREISAEEPTPTYSSSAPIQLSYQPFGLLNYHHVFKEPDGHISTVIDFSATGERIEKSLIVTLKYIRILVNGSNRPVLNQLIRLKMTCNGQITEMIRTNDVLGPQSSDDIQAFIKTNSFVVWILPIYKNGPLSIGQIVAHTASTTDTISRSHFTMKLGGYVMYRGIKAVRLDLDQMITERAFRPGIQDAYPERGYLIVDSRNGTVLKATWIGADGGEDTVEVL